jgi:HSP20 family protein
MFLKAAVFAAKSCAWASASMWKRQFPPLLEQRSGTRNGGYEMNIGNLMPWRERSQLPAMREDFFDPFVTFRREVQRMMDDFVSDFDNGGLATTSAWRGSAPVVDIDETDKEIVITAEMPGLDQKDFQISVSGDVLTIKGEKKVEQEEKSGNGYHRERRYGAFSRSLRLPFDVKNEKIDATYQKGVLTIHVPKSADAQKAVRQIEVKAA